MEQEGEMTATERLRQLLDERGVEWRGGLPTETVVDAPIDVLYVELPDGVMRAFIRSYLTPEQAVDATLGCEPNDKEMLRLHDRLNVELLRLERNVDNGNERIAAIAEAHELLEDAATLGRGTCEVVHKHQDATIPDLWQCDQCREWWWQNEQPRYCPNCGRMVVE